MGLEGRCPRQAAADHAEAIIHAQVRAKIAD